jgi:hypothetical protein
MANWKYPVQEMPEDEETVWIYVANHFNRAIAATWLQSYELFANLDENIGYPSGSVIRWKERSV